MTDVEKEKAALEQGVAVSRVMTDTVEQYNRENRRLWALVLALIFAVGIMGSCMVWGVNNAQRIATEAVSKALENIAEIGVTHTETTTTTSQSVEGDSATINNIDGEQYNGMQKDGAE